MYNAAKIKALLERTPIPPDESIPSGISDLELAEFYKRTGIVLPQELSNWLKISNGPFIGSQAVFGIKPNHKFLDIESYYDLFPIWKEKSWIAIGTDGSGNYYVMPTQQEFGAGFPILFVDITNAVDSPTYIVGSSIGNFLEFLLERELGISQWPFDKVEVIEKDPDILTFHNVKLPWEA